jgi:leucyl aminopeptidase
VKVTLKRSADPLRAKADLLVLPAAADTGEPSGPLAAVDEALGGAIARAIGDGEIDGKPGSAAVFHAPGGFGCTRVAVVGVGEGTNDEWRRAGGAAAGAAKSPAARRVALAVPEGTGAASVSGLIDGLGVGVHRLERFRTADTPKPAARQVDVHARGLGAADTARAARIVEAVNGARDLVDTPANHLTPTDLAAYARDLAARTPGLNCTVLDAARLRRLGAGALLAVAQGSDQPPKMIVLRYAPKDAAADEVLGIVGKAVTFDTGGISIKPSSRMEEMKMDMGGGATAIEAAALIAALQVPVGVLAVIPATENMPSGRAVKPGDVVTASNGKTIEIINTDAEGRLILADALTWAARNGATRMVDLATLTGAIIVALGDVYAGLFGSDDRWTAAVRAAGEAAGDLVWPLPMHERYDHLIKSAVADLANSSNKREAGPVYAAQFLREFTDDLPWCHLDVAGTAMGSKGGTGFGVRLLLELAEAMARGEA